MPAAEPISIRLARRLQQDGECIVWTGARRPGGYGVIGGSRNSKNYYLSTHRLAYELLCGPIPDGLHIDHLCRNRACVNPDHLEAVTQGENNRRTSRAYRHASEPVAASTTLRDIVALLNGARP